MLLAVLHGRVDIEVQSPTSSAHFVLASPDIGLHLAPEDWHRMRFGRAAVLLVIASLGYDPDDYITEPYAHGR